MLRTINSCEKNLTPTPASVKTISANTSTEVFKDFTNDMREIAYRTIQNVGNSVVYYAFGQTCDNASNFHGMLTSGMAVPVPSTCQVTVFSSSTAYIAITEFTRVNGL